MSTTIRPATPDDYESVLDLIKQLAKYEKALDSVTNSVAQMKEESEYFHCIVAEAEDGAIVGTAIYFFAYYTWVGKSLYLDDLMVNETYRGQKIGTKLVDEIFKIAKAEDCKRVRWQVLDWNEPAIEFYKKLGATIDGEWLNCDFNQRDISRYKSSKK